MKVADPIAVGGDHHRLVLPQFDGVAGVFDERGHIRADEHLPLAHPEHQRGGAPGGHDHAGLVGVGEHQREVALQPAQHRQHRRHEIPRSRPVPVRLRDQVHGDLGVGVAGELHPGRLQLAAQRGEVLDDPVVHHRDLPGRIAMRVRVAVGGPPVGGPPGMAQPGVPAQRCRVAGVQRGLQVDQPPGPPAHRQSAAAVDQSDTRGVIAPVLHPAQCIYYHIAGGTVPDVADDSAHSATQYCSRGRAEANLLKFSTNRG